MQNKYALEAITAEDFSRLKESPQPYSRVAIAKKIVVHIENAEKDSQEYALACDIANFLQKDQSDIVRMTLAEALCHSLRAPKMLMISLANDDEDRVAVPVLRDSPLLDEEALGDVVQRTESQLRLIAVAERKFLSVKISALLVERGFEKVAMTLLENKSAQIADTTYAQLSVMYARSSAVMERIAKRLPIPSANLSEILAKYSASEQENLKVARIHSFTSVAPEEVRQEISALQAAFKQAGVEGLSVLAEQLVQEDKLSVNHLLLSMMLGHSPFFVAAMTAHTKLPLSEVERMCDGNVEQFKVLFNKSKISSTLFSLIYWTLTGMHRSLKRGIAPDTSEYVAMMAKHMRDAETRGINFARTIGIPLALVAESVVSN